MRTHLVPAVLALALALVTSSPALGASSTWSDPRTVAPDASLPAVAISQRGITAVTDVRGVGRRARLEVRRGTANGLGRPVTVDSGPGLQLSAVALDAGTTPIVAWQRVDGRRSIVREAIVFGAHASTPLSPRGWAGNPVFIPGTTTLAYERAGSAATITEAGDRFGPVMALPVGAVFDVALALGPDGETIAVWPDDGRILAAIRPAESMTFGPVEQVSPPGGYARAPALAVTASGTAVAVWVQSQGAGNALVSAARPRGGAFGAPVTNVPASEGVYAPSAIATANGEADVAYLASHGQHGYGVVAGPLRLMRFGATGRRFGRVLTLTAPGERTEAPALAAGASAVYAAFTTGARGVVVRRVAPGGLVGKERRVSGHDRIQFGLEPAFAMAPSGAAVLAYQRFDGTLRIVTRRGE